MALRDRIARALGRGPRGPVELVVREGPDAGRCFPVEASAIWIGRGRSDQSGPGQILIDERSVSSRHAVIEGGPDAPVLRHLPSATNPTLVNGRRIEARPLRAGDCVVLGLAVLDVRPATRPARPAPAAPPTAPPSASEAAAAADAPTVLDDAPDTYAASARSTAQTGSEGADATGVGALLLVAGPPELEGRRFPLDAAHTTIGREEGCDVRLAVPALSRRHASLLWEDDELVLVHESGVNPTRVNGQAVRDRRTLVHGDELCLAERVTFRLELAQGDDLEAPPDDLTEAATVVRDRGPVPRPVVAEPPRPSVAEADSAATVVRPRAPTPPAPTPAAAEPAATRVYTAIDTAIEDDPDRTATEAATVVRDAPPAATVVMSGEPEEAAEAEAPAPRRGDPAAATVVFEPDDETGDGEPPERA